MPPSPRRPVAGRPSPWWPSCSPSAGMPTRPSRLGAQVPTWTPAAGKGSSGGVHVATPGGLLAAQPLAQGLLAAGQVLLPAAQGAFVLLVDVPDLGEQRGVLLQAAEVAAAGHADGGRGVGGRRALVDGGGGLAGADLQPALMTGGEPADRRGEREDQDGDDPAPARHPGHGRLGGPEDVDKAEDSETVFEDEQDVVRQMDHGLLRWLWCWTGWVGQREPAMSESSTSPPWRAPGSRSPWVA